VCVSLSAKMRAVEPGRNGKILRGGSAFAKATADSGGGTCRSRVMQKDSTKGNAVSMLSLSYYSNTVGVRA
jgi:hypothetical protein